MGTHNNFKHFDRLGQNLLISFISFNTYHDNSTDEYGFYDASGTTKTNKKVLFELKCNDSKQDSFPTSIITKADFDKILSQTPEDVAPFYVTFTNNQTNIINLRKIADDPEVYFIKEVRNKISEMGNEVYRYEDWVYINRLQARKKGYLKRLFKGGLKAGIDIDGELRNRKKWG